MTSIILVAEREGPVHQGLSRALMLARYLHARLDILFCDPERHYISQPDRSRANVADDARQFLDSLCKAITAPDVEITTDTGIDGPTHAMVARKVHSARAALVVKSAGRRHAGQRDATDWQLVQTCPAPLLLTQGRAWRPRARFAAAVDVADIDSPDLPPAVRRAAANIGQACSADVDVVHLQPDDVPDFARLREYDLLTVGVMMVATLPRIVDCLPARLLTTVNCDLLFVKPENLWTAA